MNRLPRFVRRCETPTPFPLLVVPGMGLIAGVVLACANWSAGGTPVAASAPSDWIATAMPMVPLFVILILPSYHE